jgi:hypothetical protein
MDPEPDSDISSLMDYLKDGDNVEDEQIAGEGELTAPTKDWKTVKARLTSHGRSRAKIVPLDNTDMPELLEQWTTTFKATKQRSLVAHSQDQFAEWHSLLLGFHLAFYGVGSMKEMVEHFVMTELSPKRPAIFINGFYPMMTLEELINIICVKIVKGYYRSEEVPTSLAARIKHLKWVFSLRSHSLILVIHSLDELIRTNISIWTAISEQLAVNGLNVHLVVTVDHHFAPTAIPASQPFLWFPCPTGLPYQHELAFKTHSTAATSSSLLTFESALKSLAALPQPNVLLFCILGNLAQRDTAVPNGVRFDLILEKAALTDNVDARTLDTQLNQLQSYRLIKRNLKMQTVTTNMSNEVLQQVLDHHAELWVLYAEDLL